jgi:hypothetical protein
MNGNVFECYEEQTDRRQYAKTLEALEAHAKKSLKFAEDLAPLFAETMTEPAIAMPDDPGPNPSRAADMIYTEKVKQFVKREGILLSNKATLHAVIWGQCSETMKARVKSLAGYKARTEDNDCFWVLKQIKAITLKFDEKRNDILSLLDARCSLLNCRQLEDQPVDVYKETLKGWADAIQFHGGTVAEKIDAVPAQDALGNVRTMVEREEIACEKTLAMLMIRGADTTKYGILIADLSNRFAMGRDEYPTDLAAAASMLTTYENPVNRRPRNIPTPTRTSGSPEVSAMTFAQRSSAMTYEERAAASVPGTDGVTHHGITCWGCEGFGHYSNECPGRDTAPNATGATPTRGTTLTQYAYMLAQSNATGIDPEWILLDSQSTISVFKNRAMLTNVRRSPRTLRALTNGGHQDSTMIGDFPNLGVVWYNPHSIANILSLADVRKICRVTMDSASEPALRVHRLDGTIMKFLEHDSGLYVYNPNDTNDCVPAYSLLNTVAEQKKLFSRREVTAADEARALYRKIGRPDEAEFDSILRRNLIRNCPVTPGDAKRALVIYGPDIAVIKGKTTRSNAAPRAPTFEAVPIPPPVLEHHKNVTLCVDFFFVQGIPFFHTISRGIGFRSVRQVPDRGRAVILRETRAIIKLYQSRGFHVCDIHADNEFECIREEIRPIEMNVVPADSHVGEVERSIRTIKERLRTCVHGLPFRRLPKLMIRHMVDDVVRCLNQFPWKNGISAHLSPAALVSGHPPPDFNTMRLEFGTYVQVFEDNDPTNTPRARSLGAIALNPTGNAQGDYHFLSLSSGAKISRHQWIMLPMTDTAIARVEALGFADDQPMIQERGLVVEWRPDHTIDESEYDRDYVPPHHDPADILDHAGFDPVDADETTDLFQDAAAHDLFIAPADAHAALGPGAREAVEQHQADPWLFDNNNDEHNEDTDLDVNDDNEGHDNDQDVGDEPDIGANANAPNEQNDDGADDNAPNDDGADDNAPNEQNDDEADEANNDDAPNFADEVNNEANEDTTTHDGEGTNASNVDRLYNLRERRTAHARFNEAMDNPHNNKSYYPPTQLIQRGTIAEAIRYVFGHIMTQMTAKAGIRKHGRAAEAALMQEFAQFENLNVYEVINVKTLTAEQRKGALRALNLIKEKRDGQLKGRTVADGSVQRSLYDKTETTSPTVSTSALLLSIIIDAYENRDVATADVAGAYLKAYMDDFVIMKFTGESVDILCKLNPEHMKFVVIENGVKVLYVRLIKAIYGCVKSALLWYELFHSTLKEMGFVLNPYDPCIANCTIDGKQCTIAWYVDDTKISHEDPEIVSAIIKKLEERFDKMTVTRGKKHVFLGMDITYTEERTAVISMRNYLQEAIDECGMELGRDASTPAKRTLFDVDPTATPLTTKAAKTFHSVVAKLLYVATRARMDIFLAIGFLCTRVSKSTTQDQRKLRRVLEYIRGTLDLEYTLGADSMGRLRTWVDASYAVHPDMKSHTGGIMSLGIGGFIPKSGKQKLNTKSSTEAELVGASDYLPNTVWTKMFLEAQGYKIEENYLEQDNESAIKLATNGRSSAGPRSRHIDIRYFWIKDRTKANGIKIRHCPTLQMLADFFTKPLQGALFRKFRDVILGYKHVDDLTLAPMPDLEERVGIRRDDGYGTDGPGADGIAIGKEKSKRKIGTVGWVDVDMVPAETRGHEGPQYRSHVERVERDHSHETILLTK